MQFVCENFVPVAVDKQLLIHSPTASRIHADERLLIERFTGGRSGQLAVYLVTSEGEPLTANQIFRQQTAQEVLATLQEAIAKFGPVSRRKVVPTWDDPSRGVGVRNNGTVRLAAWVRHTDGESYQTRPVFDSIVLTAAQWRGLLPPDRATGATYSIPNSTAREFSRVLSSSSDQSNLIRPGDLTAARLAGTVRASSTPGGASEVLIRGELVGSRKYVNGSDQLPGRATVEGLLQLDARGRPLHLLLVFEGTFKMPWETRERPTGAVVEWRRERLP